MGPWRKTVPALAGGLRPGLRLAGGLCSRRVACRARVGRGVAPGPAPGGGGGLHPRRVACRAHAGGALPRRGRTRASRSRARAGRLSIFWTVMARSTYLLDSSSLIRTYIFRMTTRYSCLCFVFVHEQEDSNSEHQLNRFPTFLPLAR